jgi:hypothetical protein
MLTLYTTPLSTNGRKVLAASHHLRLAPDIRLVNVYRGEGRSQRDALGTDASNESLRGGVPRRIGATGLSIVVGLRVAGVVRGVLAEACKTARATEAVHDPRALQGVR